MLLASVGTYSGPAGGTFITVLQGAQLWTAAINQKGGLNQHPVRLLVFDDGGDPARHGAQVRQAVEQDHVVAFLANAEAVAGRPSVDYINKVQVPIIGMSGGEDWAYSSPMYFPQKSVGTALVRSTVASLAQQVVPTGKTKLATMVCVEAAACDSFDNTAAEAARNMGFTHVYRGRLSVAQPDYTANCLAAQNAGAQVVLITLDTASVRRVAANCARQEYHPIFSMAASLVADQMKDDPSMSDNVVASSGVFPWFAESGSPLDEFRQGLHDHGRGLILGAGLVEGWVAGKLLEKAAAGLPEPPSKSAVLAGLWSMKGDTLGGLTIPLTFKEDEPAPPIECWFNIATKRGKWISPDTFKLNCL